MSIAVDDSIQTDAQTHSVSKKALWTGRILSTLVVLFMLFDALLKFANPPFVVEATLALGYPESSILGLGIVLLVCTLLYAFPRTAVLGAILLTGYLGGAVAAHVRINDPVLSIVFPVILGAMLWGGLYLRDARLRQLIFWQS